MMEESKPRHSRVARVVTCSPDVIARWVWFTCKQDPQSLPWTCLKRPRLSGQPGVDAHTQNTAGASPDATTTDRSFSAARNATEPWRSSFRGRTPTVGVPSAKPRQRPEAASPARAENPHTPPDKPPKVRARAKHRGSHREAPRQQARPETSGVTFRKPPQWRASQGQQAISLCQRPECSRPWAGARNS